MKKVFIFLIFIIYSLSLYCQENMIHGITNINPKLKYIVAYQLAPGQYLLSEDHFPEIPPFPVYTNKNPYIDIDYKISLSTEMQKLLNPTLFTNEPKLL